jgi:ATP-dependent DNA helicase DinG
MPGPRPISPLSFFGQGGLLARALDGYEERPSQQQLSEAVAHALGAGGVLLAEAGTGTGKTLAYLLPAAQLGRRVVVSTGTKNLQEQLVAKDLPLLGRALGRELNVAVMKGRANYLCLLRYDSFLRGGTITRQAELPLLRSIEAWLPRTETGDRSEIAELPDNVEFWREIAASSENCIGQACAQFEGCFVTRMRQRALEADLVVVNHHLLCADLVVKGGSYGQVIPRYDTLILDEAHLIEDVATQYFGAQVSNYRVEELRHDVERELRAAQLSAPAVRSELAALHDLSERSFREVQQAVGRRLTAGWMSPPAAEAIEALLGRLSGLRTALTALDERPEALNALANRAQELHSELGWLARADDEGHVFYVEVRGRGIFVKATPIDVAERLQELLFEPLRAVVLTSATLTVGGSFSYLRARLGLHGGDELILDSPFDFSRQALFYVPRGMPDPRARDFVPRVVREVRQLLDHSRGRAFVLFTSYANMNAVAEQLAGEIDFPLFVQGEAPKAALIESFKGTPNAVLLATASFWQGVDVVGEQLSCVIVDKLPFASPSDPVVAARIERMRQLGEDAFSDYQVPVAVLMLKQGLGRLIRSATDRGVLAVLDSRLVERPYGRRFLSSLPKATLVHDLSAVEQFFK